MMFGPLSLMQGSVESTQYGVVGLVQTQLSDPETVTLRLSERQAP